MLREIINKKCDEEFPISCGNEIICFAERDAFLKGAIAFRNILVENLISDKELLNTIIDISYDDSIRKLTKKVQLKNLLENNLK